MEPPGSLSTACHAGYLSPKMFYGHAVFIKVTARKERDVYIFLRFIAVVSGASKILYRLCLSISSVKYSPANVSAYILKLVSFSLFDRRDSDKTEKTNISLLSSMAATYMNIE